MTTTLASIDERTLLMTLFLFARRPEGRVHSPAAGLDPQLPAGGAEVSVSAGGLGQDVPAALKAAGEAF